MKREIIEIKPIESMEPKRSGSPHNMIVFCEKPWRWGAGILSVLVIFTFLWGFYVLETWRGSDDVFGLEDFSVSEALYKNAVMGQVASLPDLLSPAVVGVGDGRVNAMPPGRGTIISADGHILTSLHLIDTLSEIKVFVKSVRGTKTYSAEIVKKQAKHDLVVLKMLTRDRFLYISMADPAVSPQPGEKVYSFGPDQSGRDVLMMGTITNQTNTGVDPLFLSDVIYTNSQIGGPVVNVKGEMLGMAVSLTQKGGYITPAGVILGHFRDVVNFNKAEPLIAAQPKKNAPTTPVAFQTKQAAPNVDSAASRWWNQARMQVAAQQAGSVDPATTLPAAEIAPIERYLIAGFAPADIVGLLALALFAGVAGGMMTMGGGVIQVAGMMVIFGYGMYLIRPVAYLTNVFVYGAAALRNHKAGFIMWENVKPLLPWALVGIVIGYFIGNSIGDSTAGLLLGLFAALMVAKGLHEIFVDNADEVIVRRNNQTSVDDHESLIDSLIDDDFSSAEGSSAGQHREVEKNSKHAILGLPMGLISGVLGISGGVIEVPLQRYFAKVSLRNAIANSSVLVFWASVAGTIVAFSHGISTGLITWEAPLTLAAIMIPGAYVGGRLGAKLMHLLPTLVLKWIYVLIMAVIAVRMLAL
ncbi:MAG: TSUP family transporter [Mariprofundus sp.]|nr:TSUP family transporter [Mariprofundus sp.]